MLSKKIVFLVVGLLSLLSVVAFISADFIFIDDEEVYMSVSPSKVMESQWVEFSFTPKSYSGFVNVVFGFNSLNTVPLRAEYWSDSFNVNGSLGGWVPLSGGFNSFSRGLLGFDNWYYLSNFNVVAGDNYKLRVFLSVEDEGSYLFAVYPSNYGSDVGLAYDNNHLYVLTSEYQSHQRFIKNYMVEHGVSVEDVVGVGESVVRVSDKIVSARDDRWGRVCYYE